MLIKTGSTFVAMIEAGNFKTEIYEYLLGSMGGSASEHFDELSVTSEEFFDKLTVAEDELVDAYLTGELDGDTLEKFRSHYLASPLRRQKVEFARSLQLSGAQHFGAPADNAASSGFLSSFRDFLAAPRLVIGFSAGLLLLGIVGIWMFLNQTRQEIAVREKSEAETVTPNSSPGEIAPQKSHDNGSNDIAAEVRPPVETNRSAPEKRPASLPKLTVATFVLAPPRRGGIPSLSIPRNAADAAFRLQLDSDDFGTYRVVLKDESGKQLWSSGRLRASNKSVTARFPSNLLKAGVYSLELSGENGGETEALANYSFKALRE